MHRGKVRGDLGVRVKAVDDIVKGGVLGALHRQVRGAAAAEDHDVDPVCPLFCLIHSHHGDAGGADGQRRRVTAGEDCLQAHIGILADGALDAPGQITIANDTNVNHIYRSFSWMEDVSCR